MKLARLSRALGLFALTAISSSIALADESGWESGWYIGGNVGQSRATIDNERITSSLLGGGLTVTDLTNDDRSGGFKLFGGYQFNRYLAVESGYFDLGNFGFSAGTPPQGTFDGKIKVRGLNLDLVGFLPITNKFSAFGRAGINHAQAHDTFTGTGAVNVLDPNPRKRDTNFKVGVGLQYAFTEALAVRGELERYRINDAVGNKGDIDLVSIGLIYRFGPKVQAPVAHAPAPAYVAPTPPPVAVAPTPQPPAPPAPPAPKRVTFSADSLFDFDKAVMKPEGKQALDKFAADLKGADYDVITVIGHSDRIGSHAYNMKLSTSRAEAVKTYLAQSADIPAGKIGAKGVNGAEPVTKSGQCKGTKATRQLIACLQPDRRVEVEVIGTR
jgi:OmpA-OmpF porin, OOP family